MGSIIDRLASRQLIQPPGFLRANVQYEVIMGSVAYGVSTDTSDMDIYGFCIPPKNVIFPHLNGVIYGFGKQHDRFDQWQKHKIVEAPDGVPKNLSYEMIIDELKKRSIME